MNDNDLNKKLKSDPRFIPYNDKFDYDYVRNYLKKNEISDLGLINKALSTIVFNNYFTELKKYFDSVVEITSLSNLKILETLIFLSNRDLYLLTQRATDSINKKNYVDYEEITNSSIKSSVQELGNINAQGAIEAGHDALNVVLNLLNKSDNLSNKTQVTPDHLDYCFKLLSFTNIYTVIKYSYDTTIWEDYNLRYSKNNNEIHIINPANESAIINCIGEKRLARNIFASKQYAISEYSKKGNFYNNISTELTKKRKPKRLKSVFVSNNYLQYKLADGVEKESIMNELMSYATLTTYYEFIGNEKLPRFDNLSLHDLITIFSEIQYLLARSSELKKEESDNKLQSFDLFKLYIKRNVLIDYLFAKTKYSTNQIKQVITLLSHKDGNYNIWERPLIFKNDVLIPIFLPIVAPNPLRLIEYWLEQGGLDLDFRGKLFEEHIKNIIKIDLNPKGYYVNILNRKEFRNNNLDNEEIDLIFELKNIIVIAEIKCVRYPFDPRDYHNMYKRLKEGAAQVKRKTDFFKNNSNEFKDEFKDISKEFVPVIITNYPIYTGQIIENIPVVDLSLLENYFVRGSLNKSLLSHRIGETVKIIDKKEPILYYSNETEFSNNFKSFLFDPIPVKDLKENIYVSPQQITLPEANPKIIMDYVLFKDSVII